MLWGTGRMRTPDPVPPGQWVHVSHLHSGPAILPSSPPTGPSGIQRPDADPDPGRAASLESWVWAWEPQSPGSWSPSYQHPAGWLWVVAMPGAPCALSSKRWKPASRAECLLDEARGYHGSGCAQATGRLGSRMCWGLVERSDLLCSGQGSQAAKCVPMASARGTRAWYLRSGLSTVIKPSGSSPGFIPLPCGFRQFSKLFWPLVSSSVGGDNAIWEGSTLKKCTDSIR